MKKQRFIGKAKKIILLTIVLCIPLLGAGAYLLVEFPEVLTAKTDDTTTSVGAAESGDVSAASPNAIANSQTENIVSSEKKIYGEMQLDYSWACDVRVPENLLTDGGFAVKLKVLSVGEAKFLGNDWKLYLYPATPYQVEIVDIIDTGTADSSSLHRLDEKKQTTVYAVGGLVSVKDSIEHFKAAQGQKFGVGDNDTMLTEKEKGSNYIAYTSEYDYAMIPGEEYVAILHWAETDGVYYVSCGGYGIFESETSKNSTLKSDASKSGLSGYKNVITGVEFKVEDNKPD